MNHPSSQEFTVSEFQQQAIKNGQFMLQKCTSCETFQFYPRSFCIECDESELTWIEASGKGVVYSTTTVRRKAEMGGDFNVSLIDLEEGVRVMGNVLGLDPSQVKIDLKVKLEIIDKDGSNQVVFQPGDENERN